MMGNRNSNRVALFISSFFMLAFANTVANTAANTAFAADDASWQEIVQKARGQTVNFNAWGGSSAINDYIKWAGKQVQERYGVKVRHVKLDNTANAVRTVIAEKTAGRNSNGTIDLIWINGENFKSMKERGLLFGPFANSLPNFKYVDVKGKPTTIIDFTIPTEGYESPWGMAQLVFAYDSAQLSKRDLPVRMNDFLKYAKKNPGRVTYPAPPNFLGVTFLKQALVEMVKDDSLLSRAPDEAVFEEATKPLWAFLDELHPLAWRQGKNFPKDGPGQNRILNDLEIDFSISFNPGDASSAIIDGSLPKEIRTFVLRKGTIGNTHFVAIPYNSKAKEGAQIFADFLLSAEAQAHKANPDIWGDPTVLNVRKLKKADRKIFDDLPLGAATLSAQELGRVLPEPHPEWAVKLKKEWKKRYGR